MKVSDESLKVNEEGVTSSTLNPLRKIDFFPHPAKSGFRVAGFLKEGGLVDLFYGLPPPLPPPARKQGTDK